MSNFLIAMGAGLTLLVAVPAIVAVLTYWTLETFNLPRAK